MAKNKRVSVPVSAGTDARIDEVAEAMGESRAEVLRRAFNALYFNNDWNRHDAGEASVEDPGDDRTGGTGSDRGRDAPGVDELQDRQSDEDAGRGDPTGANPGGKDGRSALQRLVFGAEE